MNIIITGATGFVGIAVLRHCVSDPRISSIAILTRRPLPEWLNASPKVTVHIHEDFLVYSTELLEKLQGAEACLWALGLKGAPLGYADKELATKIDVDYPVAAARAFVQHLVPGLERGRKFRFMLCSGIGAELDPNASCWCMDETRKLKGNAERSLRAVAEGQAEFEVYTCRPFGIRPEKPSWLESGVFAIMPSVGVSELAAVMEDLGVCVSEQ